MSKMKIFNDPVHGIITFKFELLYDIIDHPFFQRMRNIKQMGLSNLVYPGANHTRFEHALGALHLMHKALDLLIMKGIEITDDEYLGSCIAILCHDIGHGPFSHALEHVLLPVSHEVITLVLMEELEKEFGNDISNAIKIFKNEHEKRFLCQLVSSQLDLDRLDYLSRDSFYTGVVEGRVGYDRLLYMLNVVDNQLVVEEKGISSVEKFLLSRYMMYSQVYLHKTALSGEEMLKKLVKRSVELINNGQNIEASKIFTKMVYLIHMSKDNLYESIIQYFTLLDDTDIVQLLKAGIGSEDFVVKFLSNSLQKRKLFKLHLREEDAIRSASFLLTKKSIEHFGANIKSEHLVIYSQFTIKGYDKEVNPILVLLKNGEVKEFTQLSSSLLDRLGRSEEMYFAPCIDYTKRLIL